MLLGLKSYGYAPEGVSCGLGNSNVAVKLAPSKVTFALPNEAAVVMESDHLECGFKAYGCAPRGAY